MSMIKISLTFSLILALFLTSSALAHSGEPRLELSLDRTNPGGVVEVRGVDFEPEAPVDLYLAGAQAENQIAQLTADTEGSFTYIVQLPQDLAEGDYYFSAATDDHEISSPTLVVWGVANLEPDDPNQRDDADSLLAPMPTFPPVVTPLPFGTPAPGTLVEKTAASSSSPAGILLSVIFLMALVIKVAADLRKRLPD